MIICFDIGGSAIKVAHAYAAEDVRPIARVPTPGKDFDAFITVLRDAIAQARPRPSRAAFSIAGIVDSETGIARVANIPCLNGRVLERDLSAAIGLPVDLANDADCFALAEAVVGAGRGHDTVLGLILGTGVGGGVVVRGRLLDGLGGFAGELGHGPAAQRIVGEPPVALPAFPCGCGLSGCLDAVCGARGIEMLHRHLHPGATANSHAIISGWQDGAPREYRTVAIWLEILSGPLAVAQNLLGAGIIVAGGGLSNSRPLIEALDREVRSRVLCRVDRPLIAQAECAIEPGLVGAAILGLREARERVSA